MTSIRCFAAALSLTIMATLSNAASPAKVEPLILKQLADVPGKEALMITVSYEPGGADDIHRHDAHVFVYVLEGSIEIGRASCRERV